MDLTKDLELYIEQNSEDEPEILAQLRRETYQKTTQPHMISGYLQGRILSIISKIINPNLIVEVGTFTGYSTLCLAEGLNKNGKIITIDKNLETSYIPEKYFRQSQFSNLVNYKIGEAIEILPKIEDGIDLVFLDADKESYSDYINILLPKLKKGGIVLADNILWKGKVVGDAKDKKTEAIRKFNRMIKLNNSVEVVILPIRDGISIIRKK